MQIGFSSAWWTGHTTGTDRDTGFWDNANGKLCVEDPPSKDRIFQCTSVLGNNWKHILQRFDFQRPGKHQRVPQEYVFLPPEVGISAEDQTTWQNPAEKHSSSLTQAASCLSRAWQKPCCCLAFAPGDPLARMYPLLWLHHTSHKWSAQQWG